jgi:hypothetical protein
MIPILISVYLILGIGFETLMENSGPDIIKNNKLVRGIFIIVIMFVWLPYLLVNICFPKRDIWFRKKNYENN